MSSAETARGNQTTGETQRLDAPPPAERFLQQALGTQSDVRLPSLLLTLAVTAAAIAMLWRRRHRDHETDPEPDPDREPTTSTGEPTDPGP